MDKKEPKFMQRCADCRGIIFLYNEANPNICRRCFRNPRQPVKLIVEIRNFDKEPPKAYLWREEV